jgi:hypothetical protein
MKFPVIANSGANFHVLKNLEFFYTLTPASGQIIFGDDNSYLPIHIVGTVKCKIGDKTISITGVVIYRM